MVNLFIGCLYADIGAHMVVRWLVKSRNNILMSWDGYGWELLLWWRWPSWRKNNAKKNTIDDVVVLVLRSIYQCDQFNSLCDVCCTLKQQHRARKLVKGRRAVPFCYWYFSCWSSPHRLSIFNINEYRHHHHWAANSKQQKNGQWRPERILAKYLCVKWKTNKFESCFGCFKCAFELQFDLLSLLKWKAREKRCGLRLWLP